MGTTNHEARSSEVGPLLWAFCRIFRFALPQARGFHTSKEVDVCYCNGDCNAGLPAECVDSYLSHLSNIGALISRIVLWGHRKAVIRSSGALCLVETEGSHVAQVDSSWFKVGSMRLSGRLSSCALGAH